MPVFHALVINHTTSISGYSAYKHEPRSIGGPLDLKSHTIGDLHNTITGRLGGGACAIIITTPLALREGREKFVMRRSRNFGARTAAAQCRTSLLLSVLTVLSLLTQVSAVTAVNYFSFLFWPVCWFPLHLVLSGKHAKAFPLLCASMCQQSADAGEEHRSDSAISFFSRRNKIQKGEVRVVSSGEKQRRKAWLHAIRREEKPGVFQIRDYSTVVCSEHFKERDYFGDKKHCKAHFRRDAVPSIFPWRSAGPASRPQPTKRSNLPPPPMQGCQTLFDAYSLAMSQNEELSKKLEDLKHELQDVEVELCGKMFCLAKFKK